jgi:hypothetical protein
VGLDTESIDEADPATVTSTEPRQDPTPCSCGTSILTSGEVASATGYDPSSASTNELASETRLMDKAEPAPAKFSEPYQESRDERL